MIDGLDATRRALDDAATSEEYETLDEVLAAPAGCGLTVVAGVEHAAAVPAAFLARCPSRGCCTSTTSTTPPILGVPAAAAPSGRARPAVIAGSGLVAQLAMPSGFRATTPEPPPATTPGAGPPRTGSRRSPP